jgi:16S rRNA (uracil1498-N3)-methyltransferase
MARLNSFYLPPGAWPASGQGPHVLAGDEARHLLRVVRARVGDRVRLFDGLGREGLFVLRSAAKTEAVLDPERIDRAPVPAGSAYLALGWNRALRRSWLLEKAVELEAAGILFWQAERSQGELPDEPKDAWLGQLVAGAKQSGNPWLPEVRTVPGGAAGLAAMAAGTGGEEGFDRRLLLWEIQETGNSGRAALLGPDDLRGGGRTLMVLGPEGGLTDGEAETFLEAGFEAVTLGRRVLRWETAALLCLGLSWWARQA